MHNKLEKSESYKPEIDVIRGVAMLYIVGFWHALSYVDIDKSSIFMQVGKWGAVIALGLFFTISSLMSSKWKDKKAMAFYTKRVIRIYPLYLVALTCYLIIGYGGVTAHTYGLSVLSLSALMNEAPMTLWFIAVIIIYYLVLPLLWKLNTTTLIAICGLALAYVLTDAQTVDKRVVLYLPSFIFGVLIDRHNDIKQSLARPITVLLSGVSCVGIILWKLSATTDIQQDIIVLFTPIIAYPLIMFIARSILVINAVPHNAWRVLAYTGFSAYLFHRVVYEIMLRIIPSKFGWWDASLLMLIATIIMTLIISYIIQKLYDNSYTFFLNTLRGISQNT